MIDYMVLKSSKSGLATRNQLLSDGDYFSRQYIVEFITSMSRCFSPLAQSILLELFKSCKVWHNDESTMKVLELLYEKMASGDQRITSGVLYPAVMRKIKELFIWAQKTEVLRIHETV